MKIITDIKRNTVKIVVRNFDLNSAIGNNVVFTPYPGKKFIVRRAGVYTNTRTGTQTTPPTIKITNGTTDIVAAAQIVNTTVGAASGLTIVIGDNVVTNTKPLTIAPTIRGVGATKYLGDFIIEGDLL